MIVSGEISIPAPREALTRRDLILGVRPEHVRLSDGARLRGEVFGTEYLGTTQIVTITTAHGLVKARLPSSLKAAIGDQVGLEFRIEVAADRGREAIPVAFLHPVVDDDDAPAHLSSNQYARANINC